MKNSIEHYIYKENHRGGISALWFESLEGKKQFVQFLSQSDSICFFSLGRQFRKNDLTCPKELAKKIVVLNYEQDLMEVGDLLSQVKDLRSVSVFLMSDRFCSTYMSDKIICVGKNGAIMDEFSTEAFV